MTKSYNYAPSFQGLGLRANMLCGIAFIHQATSKDAIKIVKIQSVNQSVGWILDSHARSCQYNTVSFKGDPVLLQHQPIKLTIGRQLANAITGLIIQYIQYPHRNIQRPPNIAYLPVNAYRTSLFDLMIFIDYY